MNQRLLKMFCVLAFSCASLYAAEAKVETKKSLWLTDMDLAVKQATKRKVPILLSFTGSDWCKYCVLLNEKVFLKKAFKDYAVKAFVPVVIDLPQDKSGQSKELQKQNEELAQFFGVQSFPTVMFLGEDGKTPLGVINYSGDMGPREFAWQANSILRLHKPSLDRFLSSLSKDVSKKYSKAAKQYKAVHDDIMFKIRSGEVQGEEGQAQVSVMREELEKHIKVLEEIEINNSLDAFGADKRSKNAIISSKEAIALAISLSKSYQQLEVFLLSRPEATDDNKKELKKLVDEIQAVLKDSK